MLACMGSSELKAEECDLSTIIQEEKLTISREDLEKIKAILRRIVWGLWIRYLVDKKL